LVRIGAADEPTEGLDDRPVGQRALADVDAPANEDRGALTTGGLGEFRDEPCLADPGFARDERGSATPLARRLERRAEPAELIRSTDEDGARDADRHALDYQARHAHG